MANQVGLDRGKDIRPWVENTGGLPVASIDLSSQKNRNRFYNINAEQPHYRLAQHQLDLLNFVQIVEGGGSHQQGYIYAKKRLSLLTGFLNAIFTRILLCQAH